MWASGILLTASVNPFRLQIVLNCTPLYDIYDTSLQTAQGFHLYYDLFTDLGCLLSLPSPEIGVETDFPWCEVQSVTPGAYFEVKRPITTSARVVQYGSRMGLASIFRC